jgi:putative phosphoesterase
VKIGVMADSHENMPMIAEAVKLFNREKVALVLHAGDIISPITAKEFKKLKAKFIGVFGNNDGDKLYLRHQFQKIGELYEGIRELEVKGKRIILMHQPRALDALIASKKYDVIIYGHTHRVDVRPGPPVVLNPGECGGWLTGKCTVGILDIESMRVVLSPLG